MLQKQLPNLSLLFLVKGVAKTQICSVILFFFRNVCETTTLVMEVKSYDRAAWEFRICLLFLICFEGLRLRVLQQVSLLLVAFKQFTFTFTKPLGGGQSSGYI